MGVGFEGRRFEGRREEGGGRKEKGGRRREELRGGRDLGFLKFLVH